MKAPCDADSFAVHIYTGSNHSDFPKLCINGYYVFDAKLNDAGRGINIALVDSTDFQVLRAQRFDTYESDATQLEMFLEKYIQPGDIILAVTFDEASMRLSSLAKKILYDLGSGCIQNLKFRSSWYFVSQKGMKGYSPFEKLSLSSDTKHWGDVYDERFCVPRKIVGQSIHPDAIAKSNKERRDFCTKNTGYGEFCSGMSADEPLIPLPLANSTLQSHPIFSVPIAVLAGISLYSLPMTLETLVRQPGINPKMVTVYYLPIFKEAAELSTLFNFESVQMSGNIESYEDQIEFAFNKTAELYPDAGHIIFLEEELVLAPDFLLYMSQTMQLLDKDPTLYSISAWNDNGYKGTSSDPSAIYRVEGFPGLAFMISKTTYIRQMKGQMKACCSSRAWDGWSLQTPDQVEMVVPDVSRVVHRPYEGLGPKTHMLEVLFNRERVYARESNMLLSNPMSLMMLNYENHVEALIRRAVILEMNNQQLQQCLKQGTISRKFFEKSKDEQRQSYVLYFKQRSDRDYRVLQKLCQCFGLFYEKNEDPRGIHKGMLRFTVEKNDLLLVGSTSPYFRFVPNGHQPVSVGG